MDWQRTEERTGQVARQALEYNTQAGKAKKHLEAQHRALLGTTGPGVTEGREVEHHSECPVDQFSGLCKSAAMAFCAEFDTTLIS